MDRTSGSGWRTAVDRLLGRWRGAAEASPLELRRDGTWSAVRSGPVEVRCLRGLALVTFEGDADDHVLAGGATFVAARRGRIAIWAFEPSSLRVSAPSGAGERRRDARPAAGRRAAGGAVTAARSAGNG